MSHTFSRACARQKVLVGIVLALFIQSADAASSRPAPSIAHRCISKVTHNLTRLRNAVSKKIAAKGSLAFRIVAAILLGLLMSLTPCIYPMIPITMGTLQATSSRSLWKNFLLASAYTLGIATTFALMGLLAALGGATFGAIMSNPLFVLFIVTFLAYLAGSMFGFYEMYIPRFLQPSSTTTRGGSLMSAFILGALSGTFASPCLSPGLVLLLSIVATMGNSLAGFILLFAFGFGLSIPLLLIGTFSSSLTLLPRAGMWMIEVKKIFGVMLMGMCLYYLQALLMPYVILICAAFLLFAVGSWYIYATKKADHTAGRRYQIVVGTLFIIAGWYTAYEAFKTWSGLSAIESHQSIWLFDYATARQQAIAEQKNMLLDFGTRVCSLCLAIDKKVFTNPEVFEALTRVVTVKVDCSDRGTASTELACKFHVHGYPTILLIDPCNETVIARWSGEFLTMAPTEVAAAITQ